MVYYDTVWLGRSSVASINERSAFDGGTLFTSLTLIYKFMSNLRRLNIGLGVYRLFKK
jgi:hypothetical protein